MSYTDITKKNIKELPKPKIDRTAILARLKTVIDTTLERGERGRLPPKVNMDGYEPQEGMTCVMNPTQETIDNFGRPFYDAIMNDPELSKSFFPVLPQGYHVTLIGMEYAKIQFSKKPINDIGKELYNGQKYLNKTFSSTVDFYASLEDGKRAGLSMTPASSQLRKQCREAEEKFKKRLGIYRKYPQNWHVTLGYFRPDIRSKERFDMIKKINDLVKNILTKPPCILTFRKPQICTYKDHREYTPLFNLTQTK